MTRKRRRRRKKAYKRPASAKTPLSKQEMLRRVPEKEFLTTLEVAHVFNDMHVVSVYRLIRQEGIKKYKRSRNNANIYRRTDVIAVIESRFVVHEATSSDESTVEIRGGRDGYEDEDENENEEAKVGRTSGRKKPLRRRRRAAER